MSKAAIINDTHVGLRGGIQIFQDNVDRFYEEVFFPECKKRSIRTIFHLGDVFDNRKEIHILCLRAYRIKFLERLRHEGMHMHVIPGNHDVFWKNTNEVCTLIELLNGYSDCVTIHMKPEVVDFNGLQIGMLPWITKDNYVESMEFVNKCKAPILMSHLELAGFEFARGQQAAKSGMDKVDFKRFEMVLSGHYHTKSSQDNITYLGTQFEMTWADVNDPKFFHVIDSETREIEAIQNPLSLFNKISYDDTIFEKPEDVLNIPILYSIKGTFVKIVVVNKSSPKTLEKFIRSIESKEPYELKIYDILDQAALGDNVVLNEDVVIEDTETLLNDYIEGMETSLDKDVLKTRMKELYTEALNQGSTQ